MFVLLSHIIAFLTLSAGAIMDLKTTEVPDSLNVAGVVGGILLHLIASLGSMDYSTVFSAALVMDPVSWFTALGEPLVWSLGVGAAFSVYGWGLYFTGMWGGADAFAMSVLGFAAPYAVTGPGILYPFSAFVAVLLSGFIYTLLFGLWKSFKNPEVFGETVRELKQNERRISLEIVLATAISAVTAFFNPALGMTYFVFLLAMIFLYRYFRNIQEGLMEKEVPVDELEGGEVLGEDEELGGKIEGITEEDIESIEKDTVVVREGIRFVPVFPVALLLVDLVGFRITWLYLLSL